jgi:hypothetical protein
MGHARPSSPPVPQPERASPLSLPLTGCPHLSAPPSFPFPPFFSGVQRPSRNLRPAAIQLGPTRQCDPTVLQKRSFITWCPNPSPATPRRPLRAAAYLLRRTGPSASLSNHHSAAPPTPISPASAPPYRLEASRAQHLCPEPLHHREFTKEPPPVSCTAASISSPPAGLGLP